MFWSDIRPRRLMFALWVALAALLIVKLINAFNAPIHSDTNYYLNIGVGYFQQGILTPPMWRFNPDWNIITGSGSGYGIYLLLGWFRAFGVSALSGHVFNYLVGLATLPVLYMVAWRWFGQPIAGVGAVAAFAVSRTFMDSFYIRMDALNFLACSTILLAYLHARRRDRWGWHALVGASLVLALEIHILAALIAGGVSLAYAVEHLHIMRQRRRLLTYSPALPFGLALMACAVGYAVIHILPNPDLYFLIPRHCDICTPVSPLKEIVRLARFGNFQSWWWVIVWVGSLGVLWLRRDHASRHYFTVLLGGLLAMLALNPPDHAQYVGHLVPLFAIGIGGALARVDNLLPVISAHRWLTFLLLSVTLILRLKGMYLTSQGQYMGLTAIQDNEKTSITADQYRDAMDYVRRHIPHQTVVMGLMVYYYDLFAYDRFLSYRDSEALGVWARGESMLDFWHREQPQVFIGTALDDPELLRYMQERGGFVEIRPQLWIERALWVQLGLPS
jgi:hypothetical protein